MFCPVFCVCPTRNRRRCCGSRRRGIPGGPTGTGISPFKPFGADNIRFLRHGYYAAVTLHLHGSVLCALFSVSAGSEGEEHLGQAGHELLDLVQVLGRRGCFRMLLVLSWLRSDRFPNPSALLCESRHRSVPEEALGSSTVATGAIVEPVKPWLGLSEVGASPTTGGREHWHQRREHCTRRERPGRREHWHQRREPAHLGAAPPCHIGR